MRRSVIGGRRSGVCCRSGKRIEHRHAGGQPDEKNHVALVALLVAADVRDVEQSQVARFV